MPESAAVLPAREALSADLVGGGRSDGGRPGFPCGLRAAAARRGDAGDGGGGGLGGGGAGLPRRPRERTGPDPARRSREKQPARGQSCQQRE